MCAFLYPDEYLDSTYSIDFDQLLSLNIREMTGRNLFTLFRRRRLLNRVPIYRKSAGVWLLPKREPENWKN